MPVPFPMVAIAAFPLLLIGIIALVIATKRHSSRKLLLIIPLGIYLSSLFFPALYIKPGLIPGYEFHSGYDVLLLGWLGLIGLIVGWYANPLLLLSVIGVLADARKVARYSALAAALLALDTFRVLKIGLPDNGRTIELVGLGIGAWLWLLAIALMIPIAFAIPEPSNPAVHRTLRDKAAQRR